MTNPSTDDDDILEEREEELMGSLVGGGEGEGNNRILRRAHFLKPIVSCIHEAELPAGVPLSRRSTTLLEPASWPVKLKFQAWRRRNKEWNTWVFCMESKHGNAWRSAGIYHAIMNTTREIGRYEDLVLGLAEKWCSKTNTFIFPWGEATITLQDVMVLGGYSVLGSPVSCSVQNREWKEIEMKLIETGREIQRSKAKKVCQSYWNKKFVDGGSEIEHEAFLSLWLSRFVFQSRSGIVHRRVFPLAILLARGFEVGLAPAVLASIYAELSSLNRLIVRLEKNSNGKKEHNEFDFELFSPFQLVVLWAWERFQDLQPNPNEINLGDPRFARWDGVKIRQVENVRLALEMAGESFLWRPYSKIVQNWQFPEHYKEKDGVVVVDSGLDRDFVSFAHCLRVSNLVGLDGAQMKSYFPNRVAMQFGFDQDLPAKCVAQSGKTPEVDSANYCEVIRDSNLYIPSRIFEPKVTVRYLKWWKQFVLCQQDVVEGFVEKEKSLKRSKRVSKETCKDLEFPPGFPPKCNKGGVGNPEERLSSCNRRIGGADATMDAYNCEPPSCAFKLVRVYETDTQEPEEEQKDRDLVVPPGFLPKQKMVEAGNSVARIRKFSAYYKDDKGSENRPISDDDGFSGPSQSSSTLFTDDGGVKYILVDKAPKGEILIGNLGRAMEVDNIDRSGVTTLHVSDNASINGVAEGGESIHRTRIFRKGSERISDGDSSKSSSGLFKIGSVAMPVDKAPKGEILIKTSKRTTEIELPISDNASSESSHRTRIPGLELEARITWIEQEIAKAKSIRKIHIR